MGIVDVPLVRVDEVLGNVEDPDWVERLAGATLDPLDLDQWEAQRSRLRKATASGLEVAISLDRAVQLRNGDVVAWDGGARTAVVVRLALRPVMVVRLDELLGQPPATIAATCVELGHAIGNQHWPAVVKGTVVYVPETVDEVVMRSVMKTHGLPRITVSFAPASEVIPYLHPHEARRLFGASAPDEHAHDPPA